MYCPNTLEAIRATITREFPSATPRESDESEELPEHILWMLDRIEEMSTSSVQDAVQAGRWIGWILHVCESDLRLWSNTFSRDIVRVDKKNGHDVPY